ncbi:uncharacterized protein LOC117192404 isoform X1 [Drosophila miranda]|uniref:uncharacterized protein LOC117192404 isoform X1 n=1 Tax=Drosophila miranda TaxID=7229 RepID=UPI00143F149B|nr:uncharacterized protein LOC117192404 isoform X1 [Drosophila miranda]
MANVVNMNSLFNAKDSRWLQLEVCREFQRNKCSRQDTECKFAHPPANVEVQNGKVTACYDSIKRVLRGVYKPDLKPSQGSNTGYSRLRGPRRAKACPGRVPTRLLTALQVATFIFLGFIFSPFSVVVTCAPCN